MKIVFRCFHDLFRPAVVDRDEVLQILQNCMAMTCGGIQQQLGERGVVVDGITVFRLLSDLKRDGVVDYVESPKKIDGIFIYQRYWYAK